MSRLRHGAVFLGTYARDFVVANAQVVREVVTPGSGLAPAVLRVPLRSRTPFELATLTALVGLTPGTVVLDLDDDETGPSMTVHAMHAHDPQAERAALHRLEDRLLAVLRGGPGRAS